MKYQTTVERYGRTEIEVDVQAFARDLSFALAGSAVSRDGETPLSNRVIFRVGADQIAVIGNGYQHKGRVEVTISAPDVPWVDRNMHDKKHCTTQASINPEARTIERIAADVKKRVIDPSQEPLRLQRAYAAQMAAARIGIVGHMKALQAAVPGLYVKRQTETELSANISGGANCAYVSARLNSDGSVSIQHITSMSADKFARVMAILNEKG
jgi:hypothetical protein